MNSNGLYHQIKDLHLYRNYDELHHDIDKRLFAPLISFFPNDAFYIIDCKKALLHKLTPNFTSLIDCDDNEPTSELIPLYNHTDDTQYDLFAGFTKKTIKKGFTNPSALDPFKDKFKIIYKTQKGKTILKTTSLVLLDSNGCMAYTLGQLTDITGLVPNSAFRYQFSGPHQKIHYAHFNDLIEFVSVLGERELEILKYVGKGYSSKSIGEILSISKNTVDTHRRNIIEKLEVNGCVKAYHKALDMGLV